MRLLKIKPNAQAEIEFLIQSLSNILLEEEDLLKNGFKANKLMIYFFINKKLYIIYIIYNLEEIGAKKVALTKLKFRFALQKATLCQFRNLFCDILHFI